MQTGQVDLGRDGDVHARARLRLDRGAARSATAAAALRTPLWPTAPQYLLGWHRYDERLDRAPAPARRLAAARWDELLDTYYLSANYVKAAEDKTFPGAVAAALASPWGQAISRRRPANTYFGSYREVFGRDLYEAWTAAVLGGDRSTARPT